MAIMINEYSDAEEKKALKATNEVKRQDVIVSAGGKLTLSHSQGWLENTSLVGRQCLENVHCQL